MSHLLLALVVTLAPGSLPPRPFHGLSLVKAADVPAIPGHEVNRDAVLETVLVAPLSPAERAGMRVGDLVLSLDGAPLGDGSIDPAVWLRQRVREKRSGETISLSVFRREVITTVQRDGVEIADPVPVIEGLEQSLDALVGESTLDVHARRVARVLDVRLVLVEHPHDARGPVEVDVEPVPPTELQAWAEGHLARAGVANDVGDQLARLRRLAHPGPMRLDVVSRVLRNPWSLDAEAEAIASRFAPSHAGLRPRIEAFAALRGIPLSCVSMSPLPVTASLDEHLDALQYLVTRVSALTARSFESLEPVERESLAASWQDIAPALQQGIYLHADDSEVRRRSVMRMLALAERVDVSRLVPAALDWSQLEDPRWQRSLRAAMAAHPSADLAEIARRDTPSGAIVLAGRASQTHRGAEPAILIDLGGDDVYQSSAGGSSFATRPCAAVIDFEGNDAYESTSPGAQGAGIGGVGLLIDLAGDDRYIAPDLSQGAGLLGIGALIDVSGNDVMHGQRLVQGLGLWGAGFVIDVAGNDRRESLAFSQGCGLPGGIGLLHDMGGNDIAHAKGDSPTLYGTSGVHDAWSMGCGMGFRLLQSGGLGVYVDDGGSDDLEAGSFSQGGGYYFGMGVLRDRGRDDDTYIGSRYNMGFAAHQAIGAFVDEGGDERYATRDGVICGLAWDESVASFTDRSGNDSYRAGAFSLGASAHNGFATFIDGGGSDVYTGAPPGKAGGNDYHGGTSLSVFLDLGTGRDVLEHPAGTVAVTPEHSVVGDVRTLQRSTAALSVPVP